MSEDNELSDHGGSEGGGSENGESENNWSDGEYERFELEALARVPAMPREVQNLIFSSCDLTSLSTLCALNKEWNVRITPLLWAHLDFTSVFYEEDLVERTRKFFATCDTMMDESPERFAALASHVQSLDVGRLHGVNIVHEEFHGDGFIFFGGDVGERCVFDVIARFTNLQSLSVYVKSWWEDSPSLEASGSAIARGLSKLTSLELGGQMSTDVLLGLLDKPEQLKDLTLINLISTPGQDHGPDGIAFLSGISDRFTSLETLHLCKLADLDGHLSDDEDDGDEEDDRRYASGMRWEFPRESEISVLEDWASILQNTSTTLQSLTLENRYLCSHRFERSPDFVINPGNTHPAEYGAFSIRESQRLLFPELSNRKWPKLSQLTLVGMGTAEDVSQAVSHLEPRVHVEQRPARIAFMEGDVTPEEISTPVEFGY
ncbi:unnamed protein product [Clonostachys rosea]|uniref:F-box domain-containing protein n=1 Tax=Bionectria ochroleuca TaxID=29856 RepID=A0ABY6UP74_BIOOC|nr:unnamed protein product [Clonostachys rosea]